MTLGTSHDRDRPRSAREATPLRERPRVNRPEVAVPPCPYPATPARVIRTHAEAEAVAAARALAQLFSEEAALRDREGFLPLEIDRFSQSGLWAITVPEAYGGAGLSFVTVVEVLKIVSAADPSLGQMPHNHLAFIEHLKSDGTEEQKRFFFGEVLKGVRFGNAMSEPGNRPLSDMQTRLTATEGGMLLNGVKAYATAALLSHIVVVTGKDEAGERFFAFVDRSAEGLRIVNDWASFGQRTTASGTVIAEDVFVPRDRLLPTPFAKGRPIAHGAVNQILTSVVDLGIARGALEETIEFVRSKSRTWMDSGKANASEDPFTIHAVGDLEIRLIAAEATIERAARLLDVALADPTEDTTLDSSIATAAAKVMTTEIALAATNKLFELAGTRSTLLSHGLDRHWRNARTHTLHDPVRWKFFHVGNYCLNDVRPPKGAFI